MNVKYWTTAEYTILREIAASPLSTEALLHRLPGRSVNAIRKAMRRLGLRKATWTRDVVSEAVLGLLKKKDMTVQELADRLSLSIQWIGPILKDLRAEEKVHIYDRILTDDNARRRLFRFGPGEDATPVSKKRVYPRKPAAAEAQKKEPTPVVVKRDPFQEAFFGRAAA